ncbi:MAG: hypothetical protein Athens071412_551, partial [Parcubacteria group bacterium Athens0714_12]
MVFIPLSENSNRVNMPRGYALEENEDFVFIKKGEEVKAIFSSSGATEESLAKEAKKI